MPPRKPIKRPRGRPRDELTDRAILTAALALLRAGDELTAETIARTGKVGKPTIYRRLRGDRLPDAMAIVQPTMQAELLEAVIKTHDVPARCGSVAAALTSPAQRRVVTHLLRDAARLAAYLQPVASALGVGIGAHGNKDLLVADLVALVIGAALMSTESDDARRTAARLAAARLAGAAPETQSVQRPPC